MQKLKPKNFFFKPIKEPGNTYFEPTQVIGWIIHNTYYDLVRASGRDQFLDIGPAEQNAADIKKFMLETLLIAK